jgi:uncharacterized protein (TIGR03435 family)
MTRTLLSLVAIVMAATWGAAADEQNAAPGPTFEVASVKKSPPPGNGGVFINTGSRKGTSWNANNATLRSLVRTANVPRYQMEGQIVGGPVWVDGDRFDITAKVDAAATQDDVRAMVRGLLADRFKLFTHSETRELSVYMLARTDGRLGPQMRSLDVDCVEVRRRAEAVPPRRPGDPPPPCTTMNMFSSVSRIESGGMTMEALVSTLSRFTGRPVLDRTGLARYYALKLEFAAEPGVASPLGGAAGPATAPPPDVAAIFSAVVDQLGLKLDARREPTEVLVIDGAEQPMPD